MTAHAFFQVCKCSHTHRRHDDDSGECQASGCGCGQFRDTELTAAEVTPVEPTEPVALPEPVAVPPVVALERPTVKEPRTVRPASTPLVVGHYPCRKPWCDQIKVSAQSRGQHERRCRPAAEPPATPVQPSQPVATDPAPVPAETVHEANAPQSPDRSIGLVLPLPVDSQPATGPHMLSRVAMGVAVVALALAVRRRARRRSA